MQLGLPFTISTEPHAPPDRVERSKRGEAAESSTPFEQPESERREPPIDFYYIRHRRARRYVLRVDVDGRVRVTIPRGGSRREADAFATRQVEWIRRQQAAQRSRPAMPPEEKRQLRALARELLPPRLLELAAQHGLTVTRVTVRDQRGRWGSCGHNGHICLNWRLVQMPDWVRDYVLIHELMHLRRMDHSPAYWKLVADAYPEYETARRWLKVHGHALR